MYSEIKSEYIISRAVKGSFDKDDQKRLKSLIPRHKRITLPMLSLIEEFEVEIAYPQKKDFLVKALGLLPEFAEEMDHEYLELIS